MKLSSITKCSTTLALFAAVAATADIYTWTGAANKTWDSTAKNWMTAGGSSDVAWVDGNDAVFANTAALTVTVPGAVTAGNITKPKTSGNVALTFKGSGPLSWTGWLSAPALGSATFNMELPLGDNGGGLHFDLGANCILKAQNGHTGGTYIKNTHGTSGVKALGVDGATSATLNPDGNDLALGPVPATVRTNIYVQGGKVALFVNASFTNTIHRNRTILISDNKTLYLNPNGKLSIDGDIVGEYHGTTKFPSTTVVSVGDNTNWKGLSVLAGNNYFGRLLVPGRLEIADGSTRLVTTGKAAGPIVAVTGSGSAYNDARGVLTISGGRLYNTTQSREIWVDGYGQLDICGGEIDLRYADHFWSDPSKFVLATNKPAKLTIRDGGQLTTDYFIFSGTASGNGGEVFLRDGGTLSAGFFPMPTTAGAKGIFHFDGGAFSSRSGTNELFEAVADAGWDGVTFSVEDGGAVFDTSNGLPIYWSRPLESGVSGGVIDGGLRKTGSAVAAISTNCTYTGPTIVEGGTLQLRGDNLLPSGADVVLANGAAASFSLYDGTGWSDHTRVEQTLGRVSGNGTVNYCRRVTVSGAITPDANGTIRFPEAVTLACDYEVRASATGCSLVYFGAKQDISGVTLSMPAPSDFDSAADNGIYTILEAPYGKTGEFKLADDFPSDRWHVKYVTRHFDSPNRDGEAAILVPFRPFLMILR